MTDARGTAPLISVMVPCYNANRTLPRALASLLAQTVRHWECIVVDDGSAESPETIVEMAGDPRIRLISFDRNRGRAVARQAALDDARGEYLAMLDADDWMFPNRLADQLAVLEAKPDLALVSSSMAIVNAANDLVGVRPRTNPAEPLTCASVSRVEASLVVHPSSMIRMSVARRYSYRAEFRVAEDYDFLLKVLLGRRFGVLGKLHYAYAESENFSSNKMRSSHKTIRGVLRGYMDRYPWRARYLIARSYATSAAYGVAAATGSTHRLIARRSSSPSADDVREFNRARDTIDATCARVFGACPADRPCGRGDARSAVSQEAQEHVRYRRDN